MRPYPLKGRLVNTSLNKRKSGLNSVWSVSPCSCLRRHTTSVWRNDHSHGILRGGMKSDQRYSNITNSQSHLDLRGVDRCFTFLTWVKQWWHKWLSEMNEETSAFMKTGRVKNDSWLFWPVRPNGLSWQQDMFWHLSLWIRVKGMEVILLVWKPSREQQLSPASVFLLAKVSWFEEKGGVWEKNKTKQNMVFCALMGLRLGLGDSADNAVKDSEVL